MEEKYIPTEEDFHNAVNNASSFARKRLFKKMEKVVFPRNGVFVGQQKIRTSELTGEPIVTMIGFIHRQGRPPKDLENWVTNFVLINKDKGKK